MILINDSINIGDLESFKNILTENNYSLIYKGAGGVGNFYNNYSKISRSISGTYRQHSNVKVTTEGTYVSVMASFNHNVSSRDFGTDMEIKQLCKGGVLWVYM